LTEEDTLEQVNLYVPIALADPSTKEKNTLLLKQSQSDLIEEAKSWKGKKSFTGPEIETWLSEGQAFWLTPSGTRALHNAERKTHLAATSGLPRCYQRVETFIDATRDQGGDMVLMSSDGSTKELSELESADAGADDSSINHSSSSSGEGSLSQAISEYFEGPSIADVGGGAYSPTPGYPGTLAPGEHFLEMDSIDALPKKLLHPWPAMQQIQYHVRWAPAHPMLPSPLLWFGLNNMYLDKFAEAQLNQTGSEIPIGGARMTPRDAIRIAASSTIGNSYDPAVQVEHGGMVFEGGHDIPHYFPDHPGTASDERPMNPAAEAVTQRWIDPFVTQQALLDLKRQLLPVLSPLVQSEVDEETDTRMQAARSKMASFATESSQAETEGEFSMEMNKEEIRRRPMLELDTREFQARLAGRARGGASLLQYTTTTIRQMQEEIVLAERDLATRRKSTRRKQRKKTDSDD
jgi:hypothetical protein